MTSLEIFNGDCLEVMKDISDNSIDLIICDLPYGCLTAKPAEKGFLKPNKGIKGSSYGHTACSWDVKIDLEAFWKQIKRIRRNEYSPTLHFCTTKFGIDLINSNPSEFCYDLVWDKGSGVNFLSVNKMPMRSHEMIYVFSKAGAFYNRIDIEGTITSTADKRCIVSVIKNPKSYKKDGHPTEKPEALYEFLLKRYCPPGGTVLDPTAGSFNSVFTAEKLGMNAIGIEMDEVFYKKAFDKMQ